MFLGEVWQQQQNGLISLWEESFVSNSAKKEQKSRKILLETLEKFKRKTDVLESLSV